MIEACLTSATFEEEWMGDSHENRLLSKLQPYQRRNGNLFLNFI